MMRAQSARSRGPAAAWMALSMPRVARAEAAQELGVRGVYDRVDG
jgi:hypothetical protein